jgi:hypothetical protein
MHGWDRLVEMIEDHLYLASQWLLDGPGTGAELGDTPTRGRR